MVFTRAQPFLAIEMPVPPNALSHSQQKTTWAGLESRRRRVCADPVHVAVRELTPTDGAAHAWLLE
jgi:hypothetical protein